MNPTSRAEMVLFLFHSPAGRLNHSWRRPGSGVEEFMSLEHALLSATLAEEAKFDAIFFADILTNDPRVLAYYEPLTTLSAIAARTDRIGLVATVSTTFSEPYNVARQLAQLDFLSKGRAGWNVVTSTDGAQNFSSSAMVEKDKRYEIAQDYFDATTALWDAWSDDAVVVDREAGVWADYSRIETPDYHGEHFEVTGPLAMPRMPQGRPVIAQAGQSEAGIAFAVRNAEVVFTSQNDLGRARGYMARVREAERKIGRADPVKVVTGIVPIVGDTEEEARAIVEEIADLYLIDDGLKDLSLLLLGADLGDLPLDQPIPVDRLMTPEEATKSGALTASRYQNLYTTVVEDRPSLHELIRYHTKNLGHHLIAGTPQSIADIMQEWFEVGACDGFMILPAYMPEGAERICRGLVPELVRRGLFRSEYPGTTLRHSLGLARPDVIRRSE